MSLNKARIVKSVMLDVGFKRRRKGPQLFLFPELDRIFLSRERADQIVGSLFEKIKDTLVKGEDVLIPGFGKFQVKFKWARKGRNPQTGETIIINSRRTVTFKVSRKLRDKMNPVDHI